MMDKDERIERIKQWTFYRLFEERQIDKDIDSIESDLASLRERLAEAKHERNVARRALEIVIERTDSLECMILSGCPETDAENCDCKRAALTMAEKELENDHP